jgi:hypothetical protein
MADEVQQGSLVSGGNEGSSGVSGSQPSAPMSSGDTGGGDVSSSASSAGAVAPVSGDVSQSSVGSGSAPAGSGQASGADDFREIVRQYNPSLAERYPDNRSLAGALLLAEREARSRERELEVLRYQMQMAQRPQGPAPGQAAVQEPKKWWEAPEYDPSWRHAVMQDPQTGEWRVKPGYPPDTLQKLTHALQHQQGFLDRFAFDPIGAIRPGIEEVVRDVASQLVQQNLGQYQERSVSQELVQKNADWLYQQDPLTGNRQLSEWGQRMQHYIGMAHQMGVQNVNAQWDYAYGMVQRDYAVSRFNQLQGNNGAPAVSANQQQKQQFLQNRASGSTGVPNAAARTANVAEPPAPAVRGTGDHARELQRRMLHNARQQGLVS